MRIGVLGYVGALRTGIGRYLDEVVARWEKRSRREGHEIVLFVNRDSPLEVAQARWLEHRFIPVSAGSSVGNLLWAVLATPHMYVRAKLDVLFQPNFAWTPRLTIPVVSTIHDTIEFRVPGKFSLHRILYRRRAVPRMAHRSARVLTVSETSKRDIVEL